MRLSLRAWLAVAAASLLVANIGWHIYSNWGLVTLQATKRPLREVIRDIEHQAHVTLITNLDPNTPVTLRLEKVPINDALEHLAVVTDARWRLGFALAPDRAKLEETIKSWEAGGNPDWHWFDAPLGFAMDFLQQTNIPADPRTSVWNVTPPMDDHLQAYLEEGSRDVEAAFFTPANWNPAISRPPSPGRPGRVAPTLARAAGGTAQEMFLLMKRSRGNAGPADSGDEGDAALAAFAGIRRGGLGLAERIQARINQLSPAERAAAQARFDAEKAFWASLMLLSADERRQKMLEHFNDPSVQDQLEARAAARDAMRTPEQRLQNYQNYVQRRASMRGQ